MYVCVFGGVQAPLTAQIIGGVIRSQMSHLLRLQDKSITQQLQFDRQELLPVPTRAEPVRSDAILSKCQKWTFADCGLVYRSVPFSFSFHSPPSSVRDVSSTIPPLIQHTAPSGWICCLFFLSRLQLPDFSFFFFLFFLGYSCVQKDAPAAGICLAPSFHTHTHTKTHCFASMTALRTPEKRSDT